MVKTLASESKEPIEILKDAYGNLSYRFNAKIQGEDLELHFVLVTVKRCSAILDEQHGILLCYDSANY
jgi:hypothetical protein